MFYQECKLSSKLNLLNKVLNLLNAFTSHHSSNAYLNDCKTRKEKADKNVELKLFKTKGIRTYKKFYEPRLLWFAQQREYLKHLRTDKLYIQCVLTSIKSKRQRKADKPANIFMEEDLLPIVSTQEFMENISLLPVSPQSTQHIDEHIPTISSLSQLILMLK